MREFDALDGALLIDKPAGPTSHDIVDAMRSVLGIKKIGHCGTLDPNATGLLILVIGRGTKLSEKLMASDKIYEGAMKFGETTDTFDAEGKVTATRPVPPLSVEQLNVLTETFLGDQMQLPPMVSAVKKDGVPLYKLARKGITIERETRLIHLYSFEFSDYIEPMGWFRVACTKGTYVRSLAFDLGEKIGCGAYLRHLRRIGSGMFDVADAIQFEDAIKTPISELQKRIIPFLKLAGME